MAARNLPRVAAMNRAAELGWSVEEQVLVGYIKSYFLRIGVA